MTTTTPAHAATINDLATPELRKRWKDARMAPLWESPNGALVGGQTEEVAIWHWADTRPVLLDTARITDPRVIERRVMQLVNTNLAPGADATTGLMNGTLQAMMPGETARPHRHPMNALRFVLEGAGAETTVDGQPCAMFAGDLVITPGTTWHQHRNATDTPALWLDVLDVNLFRVAGMAAFEPGPVPAGFSAHELTSETFRSASILPMALDRSDAEASGYSPVFRYPWKEAVKALDAAPPAGDGSRKVRYANPMTGGSCMALLDCYLVRLAPGRATLPMRTSASAIICVVEGGGTSTVGAGEVTWSAKDTFTQPQHAWTSHSSAEGATLFIASNREAYRRLGLLTEEVRT